MSNQIRVARLLAPLIISAILFFTGNHDEAWYLFAWGGLIAFFAFAADVIQALQELKPPD